MLLIWNNMALDGTPNLNTLHAGKPVEQGTKYIITKWFRLNRWQGSPID
jgi:prolyl 4-hydroxylase